MPNLLFLVSPLARLATHSTSTTFSPLLKDSSSSRLFALSLEGGGIEEQQDLDGRVFGSPTLYGNSVYVGTERGTIYCLDAQTLTIIWEIRLQTEGAIVASPAIDTAGYLYVAVSYEDDWRTSNSTTANPEYGTYSIFKLSPGGAKIWRFLSSYVLHSTPVVDETNEIVYFGGHDRRVIGLDMYTGKPRACRDVTDSVSSSIALLPDGSLVYSTEDGYVYACSPGCGEILWRASIAGPYVVSATQGAPARPPPPPSNSPPGQLPGYFMSSPIVLGGGELVVAVNFHGDIVAINPVDGSVKWRASMASIGSDIVNGVAASPAVGRDGSIYVTDYEGNLHGFTGNGGCPAGMHYSFASNETSGIALSAPAPPPPSAWSPPQALPVLTHGIGPPPPTPSPPLSPSPPPPPQAPIAEIAEGCRSCPQGHVTASANLNAECSYCGPGSQAVAADQECELCPSGYFRGNVPAFVEPFACERCPPGEWQNQVGASYCLGCSTAEWCLGGDECKEGHRGLACSECEKGWFIFQGSCFPCQKDARYYSMIFMGVCLCVLAIATLVFADKIGKFMRQAGMLQKKLKKGLDNDERKRAAKFGSIVFIVMFIAYLQIQGLMIGVAIPWPRAVTDFFISLGAMINFDMWGLISPQCAVEMSFETTWMIRLISPVAILVPVAGGILYLSMKPGKEELADRAIGVIVQVLHMMFVGTTLHTLQPFDCIKYEPAVIDPNQLSETFYVMDRFPEIKCDMEDDGYFRMAVAGLVGFGIYTCFYILFVASTLWKIHGLNVQHETYVPPPGTPGHPNYVKPKKKKAEQASSSETPAEESTKEEIVLEMPPEVTPSEKKKEDAKDTETEGEAVETESKGEKGATAPDEAGPVTESVEGSETAAKKAKSFSVFGWSKSSRAKHGTDAEPPKERKVDKDGNFVEEEEDEEDDDMDEHAMIVARLHPDLQVQVKRYGLLCLPFAQRAWFWELFSMANKLCMSLTATFFSRSPDTQMRLMLAQNIVWLLLLVFFKPYCAIPFKGGPLEKFFADMKHGEMGPHWAAGTIVEVGMATGSICVAAVGLSVAEGESNPALHSTVFFGQLFLVLVLIGRAMQMAGSSGTGFFGPMFQAGAVAAYQTVGPVLIRMGIIKRRDPQEVKLELARQNARENWAKLRAGAGLSDAVRKMQENSAFVQAVLDVRRVGIAKKLSNWFSSTGADADEEEEDQLPDSPPSARMVNFAKLMIRISPVMLAIFLIIPIGISGYASIYGFELDSTMDAFSIRDHPAAEDFNTFVNARDLARAQKEQEWYVTGNCTADNPQLAYRRKLLAGVDEGFDGDFDPNARFPSIEPDRREGRSLQQADETETWELQFCDRMRFYLTYAAREGVSILSDEALRDVQAADNIVKSHPKYERYCSKWKSSVTGDLSCVPPTGLSSLFYPTYSNGAPLFDGQGDPSSSQVIRPSSAAGRRMLAILLENHAYALGNEYSGNGRDQTMTYSRSVFTFCRREGRSRSSETVLYTKMAVEIGKQIAKTAQTENIHVYYGGDFVYEEQINEAAVHDILVMGGGLVLVGLFMTMHFGSLFLAVVVAFQIILSFSVTYFVYRVVLQVEQVPLLMLLGIFVIIGIGVDDAFVFYDHLQSEPGHELYSNPHDYAVALTRTFQKTGSAMFVTTTTSACSFASNLASMIPALRIFGFSIAVCVSLNFVYVLTIFPSALAVKRGMDKAWRSCFRKGRDSLVRSGSLLGLSSSGSAIGTDGQPRKRKNLLMSTFKGIRNTYKKFQFWCVHIYDLPCSVSSDGFSHHRLVADRSRALSMILT